MFQQSLQITLGAAGEKLEGGGDPFPVRSRTTLIRKFDFHTSPALLILWSTLVAFCIARACQVFASDL